jgi:D-sedoheptulose 7-phosphate isomerase
MSLQSIVHHFRSSMQTKERTLEHSASFLAAGGKLCVDTLQNNRKILICGNGGSASDALHFSAELLNRFERNRPPLAAISLNSDVATLTAIANDFDYRLVFSKQIQALGQAGDLLCVFTTSGHSSNILEAVQTAVKQGLSIMAFNGQKGGALRPLLDTLKKSHPSPEHIIEIPVSSDHTARIQETHILMVHCLCDYIDEQLYPVS